METKTNEWPGKHKGPEMVYLNIMMDKNGNVPLPRGNSGNPYKTNAKSGFLELSLIHI